MNVKQLNMSVIKEPVWNFFGSIEIEYIDGTTYTDDTVDRSFLTINAIDGNVIDRVLGY